jgi:hypothetical protein
MSVELVEHPLDARLATAMLVFEDDEGKARLAAVTAAHQGQHVAIVIDGTVRRSFVVRGASTAGKLPVGFMPRDEAQALASRLENGCRSSR